MNEKLGTKPRAWILVVGTGGHRQFKSDPILASICEYLGRKLSQSRFGLMNGGWEGVDEAVGLGFTGTMIVDKVKDIRNYQKIYSKPEIVLHPELAENSTIAYEENSELTLEKMARDCDACILIGGLEGTYETGHLCLGNNRPVLPITESGGSAATFHANELTKMDKKKWIKIYNDVLRPDELDTNYKDAIDLIMQYLATRFPPIQSTQQAF